LDELPPDAAQLPQDAWQSAYGNEQQEMREVGHMLAIAGRCPRRSTNKSLRGSSVNPSALVPFQPTAHPIAALAAQQDPQTWQYAFAAFAAAMQNAPAASQNTIPGLHIFGRSQSGLTSRDATSEARLEGSPASERSAPPNPVPDLMLTPPAGSHTRAPSHPGQSHLGIIPHVDSAHSTTLASEAADGPSGATHVLKDAPDDVAALESMMTSIDKSTFDKKNAAKKRPAAADATGSGGSVLKRPAADGLLLKRPAADGKAVASGVAGAKLRLGCARCKGSVGGCLSCRNPAYRGKRFNRND